MKTTWNFTTASCIEKNCMILSKTTLGYCKARAKIFSVHKIFSFLYIFLFLHHRHLTN